ncbi:MAG: hypothetical protein ACJAT4_000758 [Granulosicoccus sp.]|jgi:hypothetical protein
MSAAKELSNLQLEMLKTFSYDLSESQILEIRNLLAQYFAKKATDEMDKLWDESKWSNETMDKWSNEDLRKTNE